MSSSDTDPGLARGLPQLDSTRQDGQTVHPEFVFVEHLPIDGLLKRICRAKSFVLGIGSLGSPEPKLARSIVNELATRCATKSDRRAIVVSFEEESPLVMEPLLKGSPFDEAVWIGYGQSKADTKAWHAQLGDLLRWKQEFGLIVLNFGDANSPQTLRIGRLCDGVGLHLFNSVSSRESIRAMKSLQKESLPIIGAWSVGIADRKLAA